jgi:hypothetical protein
MARNLLPVIITAFALSVMSEAFAADGGMWSVSKSSGEVWITSDEVQQASLTSVDNFKPGDTIRTGRNGRVLLQRGEESILIAPNSVVALPAVEKEGLASTIVQKAGSILLEVEKRNVKHFEVETPYLAAVVKGTHFRVSVNATSTSVAVLRGQVEVADFRSGQIAQLMPGQRATALEHGKPGLSLSGSGTFNPIEHGKPRPSLVDRVPVPRNGLSAPRNAANGQAIRTIAAINGTGRKGEAAALQRHQPASVMHRGLRISSALGETKLDFRKATRGLAHGSIGANVSNRNIASSSVWNTDSSSSAGAATTSTGANGAQSSASSVAAATAAATNAGIGNGPGNGNANGNANGNGHANGGVGNGNGRGNLKH